MIIYYIVENYRKEMYKRPYQEEDCVLCIDIDENIIEDAIKYALQDTKIFIDIKIGMSVCSIRDEFKQGYGCRLARKRFIPMRMRISGVNSNSTSTNISLRPDEIWMVQELHDITIYRCKMTHRLTIGHVSYKSESEAKTYKALLNSADYKKALMDVAIEQSLKEDK